MRRWADYKIVLESLKTAAPIFGPLLLLLLGAVGWFVRRRITSADHVEKLDLASKLLDLRSKLRSPDLSQDQIRKVLEAAGVGQALLPHVAPASEEANAAEIGEPPILSTTAVMSARLISQLGVIDAKIEQVIVDIEILSHWNADDHESDVNDEDIGHVRKMHVAWQQYRKLAAESLAEDYRGGSISGAIYIAEEVRIAEAFLLDLEERLKSLKL